MLNLSKTIRIQDIVYRVVGGEEANKVYNEGKFEEALKRYNEILFNYKSSEAFRFALIETLTIH